MARPPHTRTLLITATAIALLLAAYALLGFLLAPRILQQRLPALAQERLNGRLEVAGLELNPFTLRFVAHDVRLRDAHDVIVATAQTATVDLQWSSLWQRDWHFDEVRLDRPTLHAVLDRDHRMNLAQLVRARPQEAERGKGRGMPRIVLDHAAVTHALVTFTDRTGPVPAEAVLEWLDVAVRDLATRSDEAGRYAVSAVLPGGGALAWQGELSLQPVASRGEIRLADVPIAIAWPFLRERVRIEPPHGRVTLALAYGFGYANRQVSFEASRVRLDLEDVALAPRGQPARPLLKLARGSLADGRFDLRTRTLAFAHGSVEGGDVTLAIGTGGEIDWREAFVPAQPGRAADTSTSPFHLTVDALDLARIGVRYVNRSTQTPMQLTAAGLGGRARVSFAAGGAVPSAEIRDLALNAREFEIAAIDGPTALHVREASVRKGSFSLAQRTLDLPGLAMRAGRLLFESDAVGRFNWGRLFAARDAPAAERASTRGPPVPGWRIAFPALRGDDLQLRYLDRQRRVPLLVEVGSVDGTLDLAIAPGTPTPESMERAALGGGAVTVRRGEGGAAALTLHAVQTRSGTFGAGGLVLDGVQVRGGELQWTVGADGASNWQRLLAMRPQAARIAAPHRGRGLRVRVPALDVQDLRLRYREEGVAQPLVLAAHLQHLSLKQLDTAGTGPAALALQATSGDGSIQADAKLALSPARVTGRVRATRLDVEPFQPLLARIAAVRLRAGQLSATTRVEYRAASSPAIRLDGRAQLTALRVDEARGSGLVLAWKQAQANDIVFTSQPARLTVGNVQIEAPQGTLEITRDRKLNLALLLRRRPATPPGSPASGRARAGTPLEVRVDRLHLADGVLHFADRSLVLPFERDIEGLEATLVNLSSRPGERAQLEAGGRIAPYGEAKASGAVALAAPLQFTDVRAQFENVKVPPLSPYTITFAGRAVAAGTLWLDVRYRIVNGQLDGDNDLSIQDLQLGERVQARKPVDLPLDLAVALLTDEQGRFRLRVPVRGDLRNPHFDYASVIGNAITETLGRVVTAPFRFVGRLFGGGERMQVIAFPAGSAQLTPPEQDKLNRVARMLKKRPRVALAVQAGIAPQADAQALREELVSRAVARRSGLAVGEDETPGPVPFSREQTRRAIVQLAEERLGGGAVGTPGGPGSATDAYYETLFRRLVEAQPLPPLAELGRRRNQSVVSYLEQQGVTAARLAPEDPRQVQATEDEVETQLRLRAGGG